MLETIIILIITHGPTFQEHVALENEHERTRVQVCEAEAVRRQYTAMSSALKGEAAMHNTALDHLNGSLATERTTLKKLRVSHRFLYFNLTSSAELSQMRHSRASPRGTTDDAAPLLR